jgi:hypothetical protein
MRKSARELTATVLAVVLMLTLAACSNGIFGGAATPGSSASGNQSGGMPFFGKPTAKPTDEESAQPSPKPSPSKTPSPSPSQKPSPSQPSPSKTPLPSQLPSPSKPPQPSPTKPPSPSGGASASPGFTEEQIDKPVKTAIHQVNTGNYQKLYDMFRSDVKKETTADKLKSTFGKMLSAAGDFVAYTNATPMTGTDSKYGEYYGAEVTAVYESFVIVFDVAVDINMNLVGFYGKQSDAAVDTDLIAIADTAKAVIAAINSGDYEAVYTMFRDDMRKTLTVQKLKSAIDAYISPAGNFKAYLEPTLKDGTDKVYGDFCAVYIMAEYDSRTLQYTIQLDPELQMLGLHVY